MVPAHDQAGAPQLVPDASVPRDTGARPTWSHACPFATEKE